MLQNLVKVIYVLCLGEVLGASSKDTPPNFEFIRISSEVLANDSYRGLSSRDGQVVLGGQKGKVVFYSQRQDMANITSKQIVGGEDLEMRDIAGLPGGYLIVMAAGSPAKLFKYADNEFSEVFNNNEPGAFLNSIDFWDENRGIAFGDPVKRSGEQERFMILVTEDGGDSWREVGTQANELAPATEENEHGFAASGTSLIVGEGGRAWIALGGGQPGSTARILKSTDYGRNWGSYPSSVAAGTPTSGIFSLALDQDILIAVGGDFEAGNGTTRVAGYSLDDGETWLPASTQPSGYRSCVAVAGALVLAAGPTGLDFSRDRGVNWQPLINLHQESYGFNSMVVDEDETIWLSGSNGLFAKLIIE